VHETMNDLLTIIQGDALERLREVPGETLLRADGTSANRVVRKAEAGF
jgi:hypothetical protein